MLLHNPRQKSCQQKSAVKSSGLINKLIDKLPVELHIPGYRSCGPGTTLNKRIARGDKPVNKLDSFCRTHDLSYIPTILKLQKSKRSRSVVRESGSKTLQII